MLSFIVANCGGTLEASTAPGSISLPEFPQYSMQCVWNISTESQSSRINVSITDNTSPWQHLPYCPIGVIITAGTYITTRDVETCDGTMYTETSVFPLGVNFLEICSHITFLGRVHYSHQYIF